MWYGRGLYRWQGPRGDTGPPGPPGNYTTTVSNTSSTVGGVVSGVCRMNEVNARRARLVPGWVTVFGRV